MATITGLRLSQLSLLSLGSTGTSFYVSPAAGGSYRIFEKDLYNTLNVLHISGEYQPKSQDWRFVHKSGTESITGTKTFASNIKSPGITSNSNNSSISLTSAYISDTSLRQSIRWEDRLLADTYNTIAGGRSVDWQNRYLHDSTAGDNYGIDPSGTVSLDWNNRILSGNWGIQNLQIHGNITSSTNFTYRTGISNGVSSQFISFPLITSVATPVVIVTPSNDISDTIMFCQLSGVCSSGFYVNLSTVTDNTGYRLNVSVSQGIL